MYACGPTVYDYGHIGNFRTFVAVDVLRRFLKQSGYKLKHVMNITDVDDKIIRNAARDGVHRAASTPRSTSRRFWKMSTRSNIEHPEMLVRATEHIPEMAHFIAETGGEGLRLPHRGRLVVLPHREVSRVRQALARRTSRA